MAASGAEAITHALCHPSVWVRLGAARALVQRHPTDLEQILCDYERRLSPPRSRSLVDSAEHWSFAVALTEADLDCTRFLASLLGVDPHVLAQNLDLDIDTWRKYLHEDVGGISVRLDSAPVGLWSARRYWAYKHSDPPPEDEAESVDASENRPKSDVQRSAESIYWEVRSVGNFVSADHKKELEELFAPITAALKSERDEVSESPSWTSFAWP